MCNSDNFLSFDAQGLCARGRAHPQCRRLRGVCVACGGACPVADPEALEGSPAKGLGGGGKLKQGLMPH